MVFYKRKLISPKIRILAIKRIKLAINIALFGNLKRYDFLFFCFFVAQYIALWLGLREIKREFIPLQKIN